MSIICETCGEEGHWPGDVKPDGRIISPCEGFGIVTDQHGHQYCCPTWLALSKQQNTRRRVEDFCRDFPVPARYEEASVILPPPIEDFRALYRQAFGWAESDDRFRGPLLLRGPHGSGKTWLACAIANHIRAKGYKVAFIQAAELMARIQSTYKRDANETVDELFSKVNQAEVIILDDIGKHKNSDNADAMLYDFVNRRYNAKLPVIVTANIKANTSDSSDHFHAIRSRLAEGATIITFPAVNLRKGGETPGVS